MARPEKLNKKIQQQLADMLRTSNYLETAAACAGIDVTTVRRWLKRGEREIQRLEQEGTKKDRKESKYVEFCIAIKKAMAEGEMRDVILIGNAAKESWQASAWRLERRFPERWGRREKHQITGKDEGPIEVEVADARATLLDKINKLPDLEKNE